MIRNDGEPVTKRGGKTGIHFVAPPGEEQRLLELFSLGNIHRAAMVINAATKRLPAVKQEKLVLKIDKERNFIIAYGSRDDLDAFAELIRQLDQKEPAKEP